MTINYKRETEQYFQGKQDKESELLPIIESLRAGASDAIEALRDIRHTLDEHLGDTDPLELEGATDDDVRIELPVYWCCQRASKVLNKQKN